MADPAWLRVHPGAVDVQIRVVPRSSRNRVAGEMGDRLKIQITAPPVDGEANASVLEFLAELAGVPRRCASLVVGTTGRSKTVRLESEDVAGVTERLLASAKMR